MIRKFKALALTAAVSAASATSALAASDPQIDAMFAAVDMSDLKTKVAALLMATILIPLMFVGATLVKKSIRSARG